MKKGLMLLLLAISFSAVKAQSLKELLYSGKLKNDSNSVVKSTDDLSTKIDTSTRKPEPAKPKAVAANPATDPAIKSADGVTAVKSDTSVTTPASTEATTGQVTSTEVTSTPALPAPTPKSNSKIWKERTDALVKELQAEVLPNKKVKKETYFLTVEYELAEDGAVSILNVTSAPENEFLANQVKDRLIQSAPVLAPQTDSAGKARKVKRKQNFTVTKE